MKKQAKIFLAGALVIVPVAITLYVLYSVAASLDGLGTRMLQTFWPQAQAIPGAGAVLLIAAVYCVGLLTHLWVFRNAFTGMERLVARVPGVKVIYESVRDLMKLFGGDSKSMGRVVEYRPPGTNVTMLGVLTNENPAGVGQSGGAKRVAVYLPLAYMFGGPTVYAEPKDLTELDMPVEKALRLAATANLGSAATPSVDANPEKRRGGKAGCALMLAVPLLLLIGSLALQKLGVMPTDATLRGGLTVTYSSAVVDANNGLFIVAFSVNNDTKWPVDAQVSWSLRKGDGTPIDAPALSLQHIPPHQMTRLQRVVFSLDDLHNAGIKNPADADTVRLEHHVLAVSEAK